MNILVVCHYGLYQDLTSSFVHNQIREYAALGHNVRVIIPNGIGKKGRYGGRFGPAVRISQADGVTLCDVRYVTLSKRGKKWFNSPSIISAVRLHWKKIMGDFKPDVIHAHTLGLDSELGAWLKARTAAPLVVTTHGGDTMKPLAEGDEPLLRRYCDQADRVVAVSHVLKGHLSVCGTKTPIEVIHNGYVPHQDTGDMERDPYAMIQVSHLIPLKRVEVTIRAFAKLKEKYPQMKLTVIGSGTQRNMLEQLCSQLGIADAVTFTGQVSNREAFAAMKASTYFVMASAPEAFGIVYLEAMAAGCVVVGTQGQGIADIVTDGEQGFLVPADDPQAIVRVIDRCIQDPETCARVSANGRELARQMNWTVNAEKYLGLFQCLLTK